MAHGETDIVHKIQLALSRLGVTLFKNVRGGFYPIQAIKVLLAAIFRKDWKTVLFLAKNLSPLMAGLLAPGASDLIGFQRVKITPEMVGREIAIFTAIEVKTADGRPTPEQLNIIRVVLENGGNAGTARDAGEAIKIIQKEG